MTDVSHFDPQWSQQNVSVSRHAVVEDGVEIGLGTRIWHFSHVMPGARIGRDCNIGQNVYVDRDVRIGDRCKIQNNVSVYRCVRLEDEVFLGPSCVFTNVKTPRAAFPKSFEEYDATLVKRGATIGANATIVCGVTLGVGAFIGAGAVVTRDVGAFELVLGIPATWKAWVCHCGSRLIQKTQSSLDCPVCSRPYRLDRASVTEVRP